MFTVSANTEITPKLALKFILRHCTEKDRLDRLYSYYTGDHDILSRQRAQGAANNRLVCNFAKYITDCTTGCFLGKPIRYSSRSGQKLDAVLDVLRRCDSDTQDIDLARYGSIFGTSYEMVFLNESNQIRLASLDPRSAFVVYDDTVAAEPVFGVYYVPRTNDNGVLCYHVYLCDSVSVREFDTNTGFSSVGDVSERPHLCGGVPIIEYYNNWDKQGDFEQVTSLIDAYNVLQSDRVNDKEQFVNSILVIKGQILGDTGEEERETYSAIKRYGVMTMDDSGDAKWLTRQFDEQSVDVLRRSIEDDIHKFSGVPCMNDSNFSGNSSGVAMRYKLLAFEQMTKIKERYFAEGLKNRLTLVSNLIYCLGGQRTDIGDIDVSFSYNLPQNESEIVENISRLKDIIPNEQLAQLLPNDMKAAVDGGASRAAE